MGNSTIVWGESTNSVPEQQVQYSLDYETGFMRTSSSIVYTNPPVNTASNVNNTTEDKTDHRNGNENGKVVTINQRFENENKSSFLGHICTISCGQVDCAAEENEKRALHAFSIMKPSDYKILEVTPTLFASDPICRWIVSYTHIIEPVSA